MTHVNQGWNMRQNSCIFFASNRYPALIGDFEAGNVDFRKFWHP
jgi:hypothetical protein